MATPGAYRCMSLFGPVVSVIVPVYNDPRGIELTLESITGQTYPTDDYEILVIDNNSTDDTRDVVQRYVDRYENVSLFVERDIQSPAAARNKGIENASGSILTFIDADMTVEATWLTAVVESLKLGGYDYMGCAIETYPLEGHETPATKYDDLFAFPMGEYMRTSKFSGTGCLTVRKDVFDAVGVFDPYLISAEDKEFGCRVHDAGYSMHFEETITMFHPARSSTIEQLKKSFRIGRGERQLHNRYPDRFEETNLFRLRNYLPLNPQWFHTQIDGVNEFSELFCIELYLIASLKKMTNSAGSLYEYLKAISQ